MKEITPDGKYWVDTIDLLDRTVRHVGITEQYAERLGTVWQLVPRKSSKQSLELGEVFATVESSKCLVSFRSPVEGKVSVYNPVFLENPDNVNSNDYILEIS